MSGAGRDWTEWPETASSMCGRVHSIGVRRDGREPACHSWIQPTVIDASLRLRSMENIARPNLGLASIRSTEPTLNVARCGHLKSDQTNVWLHARPSRCDRQRPLVANQRIRGCAGYPAPDACDVVLLDAADSEQVTRRTHGSEDLAPLFLKIFRMCSDLG